MGKGSRRAFSGRWMQGQQEHIDKITEGMSKEFSGYIILYSQQVLHAHTCQVQATEIN